MVEESSCKDGDSSGGVDVWIGGGLGSMGPSRIFGSRTYHTKWLHHGDGELRDVVPIQSEDLGHQAPNARAQVCGTKTQFHASLSSMRMDARGHRDPVRATYRRTVWSQILGPTCPF